MELSDGEYAGASCPWCSHVFHLELDELQTSRVESPIDMCIADSVLCGHMHRYDQDNMQWARSNSMYILGVADD